MISYLDMADAYLRADWAMALNGTWNPFYAWLLAAVKLIFHPSPAREYAAFHLLNFVIFLVGLACFHYFLVEFSRFRAGRAEHPEGQSLATIPDWALFSFGYVLYLWTSLTLITIDQGADLCIAAFVYLAFAFLLQIAQGQTMRRAFLFLGVVLALGYLTKAVMMPLAVVFFATAVLFGVISAEQSWRKILPNAALGSLVFCLIAGPFVVALSNAKGRITFSDTGAANYALEVCMGAGSTREPPYFPWTGGIPGCGEPENPIRQIHDSPAVYEFGTPFPEATNASWYDPSYWYEGAIPHLDIGNQLHVLRVNAERYYEMLISARPSLLMGFLILLWMQRASFGRLRESGALILMLLPIIAAMCLYGIVHVEARYVGAYLAVLWLALYGRLGSSVSAASTDAVTGVVLSVALTIVCASLLPGAVDDVRDIVHGQNGADNAYIEVAQNLKRMGIRPGENVASIGNTQFAARWARVARVHIVAAITPADAPEYWGASDAQRAEVRDLLASVGARAVVTDFRVQPLYDSDGEWTRIGDHFFAALLPPPAAAQDAEIP
jgi:hypothetical protein